jgi:hypothetical protein
LNKFGSIEFRHLLSTKDRSRVKNWINLLRAIKLYAKENVDTDLSKMFTNVVALNAKEELRDRVFGKFSKLLPASKDTTQNVFAVLQNLVTTANPGQFVLDKLRLI